MKQTKPGGPSPRVLFNADCNTFFYDPQIWQPEGGPYSAQAIHRYVRAVAGLGFDTLVINPNCQVPWHPSKTLRSMLDGYTRGNADFFRDPTQPAMSRQYVKLCDLYLDLLEAGVDWLAETARACRQHGLAPWLSVRMNDMHQAHAIDAPEHCDLFRDPVMRLSGRTPDPAAPALSAMPGGLNYGKREVRDYMFELIRAVVEDYDFEGLELDWLRTPQCCEPNPPQADVDLISEWHAAEFLEIDTSMPQAKVLYLAASGEGGLRMSALATRLGVTLSTVSGLVDRLVDAGLAARRDDPVDRRQVIVSVTPAGNDLMERFRELNRRQARELFGSLADDDLDTVERAFELLAGAAGRVHPGPGTAAATSTRTTAIQSTAGDAASTGEGNPS